MSECVCVCVVCDCPVLVCTVSCRRSGRQRDQEEGLPGGEAMLELLTRLMECQTTLTTQLEVGHTHCHTPLNSINLSIRVPLN